MNKMHEANRRSWDAVSESWQAWVEANVDWRRCPADPRIAFLEGEIPYLGDVRGKDACVLGSGDNLVVFTLAGMGARVTSVDISQTQLGIAARRAAELGLDVAFLRTDVCDVSALNDGAFDLVYTGGHVAGWISDLYKFFAEAGRTLKHGGTFIVSEYHPFRRIWKPSTPGFELEYTYFDRGPSQYDRADELDEPPAGGQPSFEFFWSVSDFVTAMMDADCEIIALKEFSDKHNSWENPLTVNLPARLFLVGRKRAGTHP